MRKGVKNIKCYKNNINTLNNIYRILYIMIQHFMIFSERCTGSHFLQYALTENFNIQYLSSHHKHKHFFGHENDIYTPAEIENTLFICLTRDPVEWIDSFFKRLHHVPQINRQSIDNFLKNEWYSIYEEGENAGKEIMEDRNMNTNERYKNIFEMRKNKNDYFLHKAQTRFKHILILKYEDLRDNYETMLENIKNKYNLQQKHANYIPIVRYKGTYTALYYKKPILLTDEIQEYIKQNVDVEQEKQLGYLL